MPTNDELKNTDQEVEDSYYDFGQQELDEDNLEPPDDFWEE